jgi:L,D-transpeptidase catalytic domain
MPSHVEPLEPPATPAATCLIRRSPPLDRNSTGIRKRSPLLLCLLVSTILWSAAAQVLRVRREPFALRESTQLLVVTTPEWNAYFGVLQRYERSAANAPWIVVGHPIAVVVGKNGLAWDAGSEAVDPKEARDVDDPVKKEGDLRSPAGIFHLGTAFGYASEKPDSWRMPYLHLTSSTECVDDPKSKFYNQVLDRAAVSPDWKSSEHMLRNDDLYRWGLVVQQNVHPAQPGDGSCIFLHTWPGPGRATVGCTATAEEQIEAMLGWLDPAQNPLLVQLPMSKYVVLQKVWGLPAIH